MFCVMTQRTLRPGQIAGLPALPFPCPAFAEPRAAKPEGGKGAAGEVLRDDAAHFARFLQTNDSLVHRIRSRAEESLSSLQLVIPMFDPGRFRDHEILEVNRLPSRPNTLWSAKIGDATASGNAGAGENDRSFRAV